MLNRRPHIRCAATNILFAVLLAGNSTMAAELPPSAPGSKANTIAVPTVAKPVARSISTIKSRKIVKTTITRGKEVHVEYPQFTGANKIAIDKLNKLMRQAVNDNMPAGEASEEADSTYTYSCEYTIHHLSPDLVSVSLYFYSFTGGAHGNGSSIPFNYTIDGTAPREITIENVFGRKPHLATLQKLVRPKLFKHLYDEEQSASTEDSEWINQGTENIDSLSDISIDRTGITFNFQSYQVACYAAGAPSIKVTFNELRTQFAKSSPVYQLATASAVHPPKSN